MNAKQWYQRKSPLLLTAPTTKTHNPNTFSLHRRGLIDLPLRCPVRTRHGGHFRVVGSVDGLILFSDDLRGYTDYIIIWNPSIRKSITLPRPQFCSDIIGAYTFMLGFGVDPATGDYKVVRLVYRQGPCYGHRTPPLVEVCSLRDRSWRTVSSTNVEYQLIPVDWSQCFIHGVLHWIGWKCPPGLEYMEIGILLFDVEKEEFKKMALPEGEKLPPGDFTISVIGGKLAVFANNQKLGSQPHVNVWVKRDYYADVWTKMLTLDFEKLKVGTCLYLQRVCRDGGEGDVGDRRLIHVPPKYGLTHRYDYFVFSYTESLVLLGER